jgi:outer membrane protein insertion porin family
MQIAGGPLGGDTAYLKPVLRFTGYRQAWGSRYFALHAQAGYVTEWSDGSEPNNNNINGIPRYQRFWLGGDTLGPRVFETRTITPVRYVEVIDGNITRVLGDPRYVAVADLVLAGGQPTLIEVGGDRMFLLQGELVWPLNPQAEIAGFLDVGDSLFEDQHSDFSSTRVAAGLEVRFHLPVFPVPLRLIWGIPLREQPFDRTNSFTFSIGRSF